MNWHIPPYFLMNSGTWKAEEVGWLEVAIRESDDDSTPSNNTTDVYIYRICRHRGFI